MGQIFAAKTYIIGWCEIRFKKQAFRKGKIINQIPDQNKAFEISRDTCVLSEQFLHILRVLDSLLVLFELQLQEV